MPWYRNRGGEHLWYEDAGTGCPVVLVHGWCMSSSVWKYQYDGLAASCRLVAPDLRGHGRSRELAGQLDFATFAADLVDLFDALELSKAILVGWSMGAQIALQACAGLSGRLDGMVLVSPTPRFTAADDFPHGLAASEAAGMGIKVQRNTKRALDGFHTRLFSDGEFVSTEIKQLLSAIQAPDTAVVLGTLDALVRADMRHLLADINTPTLVVNGAHDRICLPGAARYLKEHIPGAEQTVFPCCGHAPFLTHAQQFNDEIIRFTRRVCEQSV